MNLQEFHMLLHPARKRLSRLRLKFVIVRAVNCAVILIPAVCLLVIFNNQVLAPVIDCPLSQGWIAILFVSILSAHGVWFGRSLLSKIPYLRVVAELDAVSNDHNMILTASEFIESGRDSEFAHIAIQRGIEKAHSVCLESLNRSCYPIRKVLLCITVGMVIVSFVSVDAKLLLPGDDRQRFSNGDLGGHRPIAESGLAQHGFEPKVIHSFQETVLGDMQQGVRLVNTGGVSTDVCGSSNAALSKMTQQSDSQTMQNEAAVQTDLGHTINKATISGAGNAVTPPVESTMNISSLDIHVGLDEDQSKAKTKEKDKQKNFSNSSRRPFTDDHRAAPGRELGRSGKKGKPGNGRGGLGSVKKSRSTAALFPGEMITVHVPSRPGKGKSKSFETHAPLQSHQQTKSMMPAAGQSIEGRVTLEPVEPSLKIITKRYFEELNAYANRKLRESTETD